MPEYLYQYPAWPRFTWDQPRLTAQLAAVRHRQGRLLGRMAALGFPLRAQAVLYTLTEDVLKTSAIEGEQLDPLQVRSSLARRLGVDIGALVPADRHVDGVVELLLDATQNYAAPLTATRLYNWHAALFPTGRSGLSQITVGAWRTDRAGPMRVVSGPMGREKVHYIAPPARRLATEMKRFLLWFNRPQSGDPVLNAGIAHLWFITLHPFADGNGRIARALTDLLLARCEQSPQRFYSMSAQIRAQRAAYYAILEATQKGPLDITPWLVWYLDCLDQAFAGAETTLAAVLTKAQFWQRHADAPLNARQRLVLNRLLDGFTGKLTSSKWAKLAKCSPDTALRDLGDLVHRGILTKAPAGGRSTSYSLSPSP
ncbi:MAG: Fic family protein [Phycisphaerae bacterium]